jgi:mannose-6-phosphate isomerase-like protein (cupin superfamily)
MAAATAGHGRLAGDLAASSERAEVPTYLGGARPGTPSRTGRGHVPTNHRLVVAHRPSSGQSVRMATALSSSPVRFEGSVADIARDWSITVRSAPPGPPRRIDGYTIGAIPNIDGPGPHGGEVHPDGDEFLYVVSGTMELMLDDGDERAVGDQTKVVLRSGDAYVVPRGVWHRLEPVEPSYLIHVTPGPNGGYRPRTSAHD